MTVFDNDPAVTVDKSTVMDTEGGVGDSFSVVLNAPPVMSSWLSAGANGSRPQWYSTEHGPTSPYGHPGHSAALYESTGDVNGIVVNVTLSSTSQVDISPPVLFFTATNWNVPQMVSVKAVDDWVDEDTEVHTIQIAVQSADPSYGSTTPFWSSTIFSTYNSNPDADYDPVFSNVTATIHDDDSVGVKLSTLIVETQEIDNIETPYCFTI